jgi:hypothetical protein
MDMATVGWVVLGWFAAAFIVSLGLGRVLRQIHVTDDDLVVAASKRKGMRFMRAHGAKPAVVCAKPDTARVRETGKHAIKAAG